MLDRFPHRVALGVAILALLIHSVWLHPWTIDDAYIYLRYAQNLAAGNGVVYNVGERVEGYTTFLWVLLLGAGGALGIDLLVLSKILGIGFAIGSLALVASAHRFVSGLDPQTCAVATVLLASCGVFTAWATGGMDATMVAFFNVLLFVAHGWSMRAPGERRRAIWVGAVGGLAVMARPECILVLFVAGVDRLVADWRRRDWTSVYFALAFAAIYAPFYAWRFDYYGHPLPNTFYAKVGGSAAQLVRGSKYVGKFLSVTLLLSLSALASIPFARRLAQRSPGAAVLSGAIVLHTLYVLAVGGDAMPAFRFFVGILPLVSLAAGLVLTEILPKQAILLAATGVVVAFNVAQTAFSPLLDTAIRGAKVGDVGREVGLWLKESYPPETVIAVNAAGAIAYYSELRVIDMLGLNDDHIAHRDMASMGKGIAGHEKGDGAYVLSLSPDLIQFGPSWGWTKPMFIGDREISRSPEFHERYEMLKHTLPSGRTVVLYRAKDRGPSRSGVGGDRFR